MASSNMKQAENNDQDEDDDLFTLKPKSLKKSKQPNPFSFKEFLSSAETSELPAIVAETLPGKLLAALSLEHETD